MLFLAVLFQVALGRILRAPHAIPFDVFLILTVYYAGSVSQLSGTVVGAIAGLLSDALSPQLLLGRQGIALAVTGYVAGTMNAMFVITAGLMKVISVFAATLVAKGALALVDVVLHGTASLRGRDALIEAAINAAVAPVLFWLLERWHQKERDAMRR